MRNVKFSLPVTTGLAAAGLAALTATLMLPADAARRSKFVGQYQVQLDLPGAVPDQTTLLNLTDGNAALDAGFTLSDDLINETFNVGVGGWVARRTQARLNLWYKPSTGGTAYWRLSGTVTPGANNSFAGTLTLERFPTADAATADAAYPVNVFARRLTPAD